MSDSGFVPPREWHWTAWILLAGAMLVGLGLGMWAAQVQYRTELEAAKKNVAIEQQTEELGEQIGSVDEDLTMREQFQSDYVQLQQADIEALADEKYQEKLLEYEAERKTKLQLMQSEAEEAYVVGHWTDPDTGAATLYRRILQYEPEDAIAEERLGVMADRFLERSVEFENKGDLSAALGYVKSSLEVMPSEKAADRLSEISERIAIEELSGRMADSKVSAPLGDAKRILESPSSDIKTLKQGVDRVEEYRNNLGIQYDTDWINSSAKEMRKRGLALIESEPQNEEGYELLQLASALDGDYVDIPTLANAPSANNALPATPAAGASVLAPESEVVPENNANASVDAWDEGYTQYINGQYGLARSDFETASRESNDPRAQFYLALMYGEGSGVQQDTVESQKYLAQSAPAIRSSLDRNESWAQFAQGVMYEKGWLVQKNEERALNSYVIAATGGDVEAQYRLGRLLQTTGGTRAGRTGAEWVALAIANGHSGN